MNKNTIGQFLLNVLEKMIFWLFIIGFTLTIGFIIRVVFIAVKAMEIVG